MRTENVTFRSDGLELAGVLRVPEEDGPHPAVVFTGPLSGVKEQVTGHYAHLLAEAGYVTLSFDHRNFGASQGEPRQHEDTAGKLNDLTDAVSFLTTRPEVAPDRIAACGICLGGGYALRFAGFDPRVRAVACVAGGYNDPDVMRQGMGAEGYRAQLASFAEMAQRQYQTGEVVYFNAVDAGDGKPTIMGGTEPAAYYLSERSASPGWKNQLTALTVRSLITADLACGADFLSPTPLLMIHGRIDEYLSPEGAQATFDRAGEPKEFVWLDATQHIELYDVPEFVEPAVEHIVNWFGKYV